MEIPNKVIIFLAEDTPLKDENVFITKILNKRTITKKNISSCKEYLESKYGCSVYSVEVNNCFSIELDKDEEAKEMYYGYRSVQFYLDSDEIQKPKYYKLGIEIESDSLVNILISTRTMYDGKLPGKFCISDNDKWYFLDKDNKKLQSSIKFGKLIGDVDNWKTGGKEKLIEGHLYLRNFDKNSFRISVYLGKYNVLTETWTARRKEKYDVATSFVYYNSSRTKRKEMQVFLDNFVENCDITDLLPSDDTDLTGDYLVDSLDNSRLDIYLESELDSIKFLDLGEATFPDGSTFSKFMENPDFYCLCKNISTHYISLVNPEYLKTHLNELALNLVTNDSYIKRRDKTSFEKNLLNKNLFGFTQEECDKLFETIKQLP